MLPSDSYNTNNIETNTSCNCMAAFCSLFSKNKNVSEKEKKQTQLTSQIAKKNFNTNFLDLKSNTTKVSKKVVKKTETETLSLLGTASKEVTALEVVQQIKRDVIKQTYNSNHPLAANIGALLKDISSTDLKDPNVQKELIDLAMSEVKKGGEEGKLVSQYIKNFGIYSNTDDGQTALRTIALLSAEQGVQLSLYIQNYQIDSKSPEGRKTLEEISQLDVKHGFPVSPYIQNYCIESNTKDGLELLLKIASYDANLKNQSDDMAGYHISLYLQNYGINFQNLEGKNALFEIAKLELNVFLNLKNYGADIKEPDWQQKIGELASFYIKKEGGLLPSHIMKLFPITDENKAKTWSAIAKDAAISKPIHTIKNLDNCDIDWGSSKETRQARREILSIAIQEGGIKAFDTYKSKYNINSIKEVFDSDEDSSADEKQEKDFSSLDKETIKYLNSLGEYLKIKNQEEESLETFSKALSSLPLPELLNKLDSSSNTMVELENDLEADEQKELMTEEILDFAREKCPHLPTEGLIKLIEKDDLHLLKTTGLWAISIARCLSPIPPQHLLNVKKILEELMQMPDPQLRYVYSDLLIKLFNDQKLGQVFDCYNKLLDESPSVPSKLATPYSLIIMAFAIGAEESQNAITLSKTIEHLTKLRDKHGLMLKNGSKVNSLLRAIMALNMDPAFSIQEKVSLFDKMINRKNAEMVNDACLTVSLIISLGKQNLLKALVNSEQSQQDDLEKAFTDAISDLIPNHIKIQPDDLNHLLQGFRDRHSLILFFAQLKRIEGKKTSWKEMQPFINNFWENFCNNNYPQYRYEGGEHLAHVFKYNEHLKTKWAEGQNFPLKEEKGYYVVNTDNLNDLLVCGTEVPSCLNIKKSSSDLKSLFNYIDDGKNRLIAVIDEHTGKIKSRAILRILLTDNGEPVLFLEKFYPGKNVKSTMKKGMIDMAIQTAEKLKLPLVVQANEIDGVYEGSSSVYPNPLFSLSTRGFPFEYVDSVGGVCKNEKFAVDNSLNELRRIY